MVSNIVVRDLIGRGQRRRAAVVIVELPGRDHSVRSHTALHLHDGGRTAIGLRELFLPGPSETNRVWGTSGQPGRFQLAFGVVFGSVTGARIRHDYPDLLGGYPKCLRDFVAHDKGSLRSAPHG